MEGEDSGNPHMGLPETTQKKLKALFTEAEEAGLKPPLEVGMDAAYTGCT